MDNTHKKNENSFLKRRLGRSWRDSYAWVLLANAGYILVFYILMKIFS